MDDGKLLRLYVQGGSEAAFGQIVTRHRALVYATCLRETGSPSQAEDAAQVVFLLLARKSKHLRPGPSLAGWLFRTARFVARDVRKQEARRQRREETVFEELAPRPKSPAPEWQRVEPLLNGALSALRPADRELILLRFLEGLSLSETGASLGLSEDAARMRVTRAVEKMRRWLKSHGASVTSIALTMLLTTEAARPIPTRAAEAITQGTLQAISASPTANVLLLSKGVYQTMKIVQLKIAALTATTVLIGASVPPLAHALIPHKPGGQTIAAPSLLQQTSAQATATQTTLAAPATGTQTIVLQHTVPIQVIKFLHWDQAAKLPLGVTKVEAVPAQNALAVTATPAGLAKVQEIVKSLDVEPRQVLVQAAFTDVTEADLAASGVKFDWVPQDKPLIGSAPVLVRYASGEPAARLLQTLTKQNLVKQAPDVTTTNNTSATVTSSTTSSSGQVKYIKVSVTPRINSDSSITLALRLTLSDGSVKREISTLRTISSGSTIVIVLPPAASPESSMSRLLFVTPTLK